MNRLFRRQRRRRSSQSLFERLLRNQTGPSLLAEPLERRLLLTTLVLPEGALDSGSGETEFFYSDPEENEPGEPGEIFNVLRIGTLSGTGPEQDVIVEVLDHQGNDIGGFYTSAENNGQEISLYGGPSGGPIIDEIPSDMVGFLNANIHALATDSGGNTYGKDCAACSLRHHQNPSSIGKYQPRPAENGR